MSIGLNCACAAKFGFISLQFCGICIAVLIIRLLWVLLLFQGFDPILLGAVNSDFVGGLCDENLWLFVIVVAALM